MSAAKAIFAILLAGGKSSRMNQDKATLLYDDSTTLLEHQKTVLSQIATHLVVSRNQPSFVNDLFKDAGPLAGVHAAVNHIISNYPDHANGDAVIMPVDMPLITPDMLSTLIHVGREQKRPTYYAQSNLPIYVPHVSALMAKLTRLLGSEQRMVNTFLQDVDAMALTCDQPDRIVNANTPMQWKMVQRGMA